MILCRSCRGFSRLLNRSCRLFCRQKLSLRCVLSRNFRRLLCRLHRFCRGEGCSGLADRLCSKGCDTSAGKSAHLFLHRDHLWLRGFNDRCLRLCDWRRTAGPRLTVPEKEETGGQAGCSGSCGGSSAADHPPAAAGSDSLLYGCPYIRSLLRVALESVFDYPVKFVICHCITFSNCSGADFSPCSTASVMNFLRFPSSWQLPRVKSRLSRRG